MEHTKQPQERTCLECGSVFVAQSPTRKFCHTNCKSAYDRKKKKQQAQQQSRQVEQQRSEINHLKARPQILSQGPINPEWQAADRRCQAQESRCQRVAQAIEDIRQERRKLTAPGKAFSIGAGIGFLLVVLIMASSAETRRHRRLCTSAWGFIIGSLVLLSLLGGWLGEEAERKLMSAEERQRLAEKMENLNEQETARIAELATEKCQLEALIRVRDALDPNCPPLPGSADEGPPTPIDPT